MMRSGRPFSALACLLCAAGVLIGTAGDEDEPPLPPPAPVVPFERVEVIGRRPVVGPQTFDFVRDGDHALLVFGQGSAQGGRITLARLGPKGGVAGEEQVYAPRPNRAAGTSVATEHPQAVRLAAAAGRFAVAWASRDGGTEILRVILGDAGSLEAAPPIEVMRRPVGDERAPSPLGVGAGEDGRVLVLYEVNRATCPDGRGECGSVSMFDVQPGLARLAGGALSVPAPCRAPFVGPVANGDAYHFGVCSRAAGDARTTLYTLEPGNSYASAEERLRGCDAIGFGELPQPALFARCGDARRAVRLRPAAESPISPGRPTCVEGRPQLALGDAGEVRFEAPASGLEAWLVDEIAPAGSRAIWTGETLLVASPQGRAVRVRRYECEDGAFRRTDIL